MTFESPRTEGLSLFRHGQLAYEHLLLTPPKSKGEESLAHVLRPRANSVIGYGPSLTPKVILDYVNAGGNVLLSLSSESGTPSAISSLLLELDISLPQDKTSVVVDHFNYDATSAGDKHDVLLLNRPGQLRPDVQNFFGGDGLLAVPRAVGQTLGNSSPLIAPILKSPATAYAYNPKDEAETVEETFATGSQLSLISSMQARNSARFTVLGSLEMLQDKWFDASVKSASGKSGKTVNQEFAKQLTEWTFKEVGVLKVFSVQHREVSITSKASENTTEVGEYNPTIYRIKNDVVRLSSLVILCPNANKLLGILYRSWPVRQDALRAFLGSFQRRSPTGIHHALAVPPHSAVSVLHDRQQHDLQHHFHHA